MNRCCEILWPDSRNSTGVGAVRAHCLCAGFPLCTLSLTALTRNAGRMMSEQTLQCKF